MGSNELLDKLKNKYDPNLEDLVKMYVAAIGDVKMNTHKHVPLITPEFQSDDQRRRWEIEEIRKCKDGHNGLSGCHYFYITHCKIKHNSGRIAHPDYRRTDAVFFDQVESCLRGKDKGSGIINVKRRRIGHSWKFTAVLLYEAMFYPNSDLGMQSKSEDDVKILLNDKLKFIYNNLPQFLRAKTYGNNVLKLRFGKTGTDTSGNKVVTGNQSNIICKSPTDCNWEGMGLKIWGVDEAGKTANLNSIISLTLPCLNGEDGFTREGVPLLFGTAGDVDTVGLDYSELWKNADAYDLIRIFTSGWEGLNCDEYGNEDIAANVRWILLEREKKKNLSQREYFDFVQQYPLTIEEAFITVSGNEFDSIKLNIRKNELEKEQVEMKRGNFRWADDRRTPEFYPDAQGYVQIIEHPIKGYKNLYVAGADPYDHKKKKNSGSSGSLCIYKRFYQGSDTGRRDENGEQIPEIMQLPVLLYTDDGTNPTTFYEQSLMACLYYNDAKVLIEKNRVGMMRYFEDIGYSNLLKNRPMKANKTKYSSTQFSEIGLYMDEDNKRYMMDCLRKYIDENVDGIFFVDLLEDLLVYDPDNQRKKSDKVDAFGITLIHAADKMNLSVKNPYEQDTESEFAKGLGFKRIGGKIVRN